MKRLPDHERIGSIIVPDIAKQKGLLGEVVAVGSGRWVPGEWWYHGGQTYNRFYDFRDEGYYWIPGYREAPSVHPGQKVYFNAKWNDFAGDYLSDLPVGHDPMLHLIQEADIFLA